MPRVPPLTSPRATTCREAHWQGPSPRTARLHVGRFLRSRVVLLGSAPAVAGLQQTGHLLERRLVQRGRLPAHPARVYAQYPVQVHERLTVLTVPGARPDRDEIA